AASVASGSTPAPAVANSEPATAADPFELVAGGAREDLAVSIGFASNGTAPLPSAIPRLSRVARTLREHPEILLVQVQGHADERGEHGHNLEVTRARAAAVLEALVTLGVERERLHGAGYGARCPADPACRGATAPESCHAADRWENDRRVVFVPLKAGTRSLRGELVCAAAAELIPPEDRAFHSGR
ncbi:MAG TPA: OmpA family protein, partial [Polyangiaceae bacterium]